MSNLNITIIQANFTIGAIENNLQKIITIYQQITQTTNSIIPDLLVFSENSIPGYPADDLYLQKNFQDKAIQALDKLKSITKNNSSAILVGGLSKDKNNQLLNSAFLIKDGNAIEVATKMNLPNYGVFDDQRHFSIGQISEIFEIKGHKIGTMICEDMWYEEVPRFLSEKGARILIAMNASPFNLEKDKQRKLIAKSITIKNKVDLLYVNQVGGQDELVFDGGSFACNADGNIIAQLNYFNEDSANIVWNNNQITANKIVEPLQQEESIYRALMLGLSDYMSKNGFKKVILGLSGGVDSALTAYIAVDALGAQNVKAVMLPSQYTSQLSSDDAISLAKDLGIELINLPIEGLADNARLALSDVIKTDLSSVTDQNIQARIRGLLLMSLSNQFGYLLLSTGNKSENAVGYATLYGDMCGGYNLLKDVYKTQVYQLSSWRKLPSSIINKAPSAELKADQKDQDTLPDYELLDRILFHLIEDNLSIQDICSKGYDVNIVKRVFGMLKNSEYKRRQSCPGPIISTCSLSKDRRYPITNHFNN
jgi:NAD+ synthase